MIPIALFKKFLSEQFIASVEVSNIARCSSKTNELRDIDSIGCTGGGGGGGGSLIFSYIHRLGPFFWVQNFEFQFFGGFSEK